MHVAVLCQKCGGRLATDGKPQTVTTSQVRTARECADPALGRVRIRAPARKNPVFLTQQQPGARSMRPAGRRRPLPRMAGPHPMHRAARPCGAFRPPPPAARAARHGAASAIRTAPLPRHAYAAEAMPRPERQPCAPAASDSPRPRPRARNPGRPESPSSGFSRIGAAPRRGDHAKRRPLRRRENLAEDAAGIGRACPSFASWPSCCRFRPRAQAQTSAHKR